MPLHFDLSKIKDFETVCYIDGETDRELSLITESLIKIDVGYHAITDMNAEPYFRRLCLLAAVEGAPMLRGDGTPRYITQDEVNAHIGLSTNKAELTDAKFKTALWHMVEDRARALRIEHRVAVTPVLYVKSNTDTEA